MSEPERDERDRLLIDAARQLVCHLEDLLHRLDPPAPPPSSPADRDYLSQDRLSEHRRLHRSGHPSKIASDAELETFLLHRIERMTFKEAAQAVAEAFPPDRRVSLSAIYRWHRARSR